MNRTNNGGIRAVKSLNYHKSVLTRNLIDALTQRHRLLNLSGIAEDTGPIQGPSATMVFSGMAESTG